MLASLTSFLPSAFTPVPSKPVQIVEPEVPGTAGHDTDYDDAKSLKDEQGNSSKKRDKKDKTPHEACPRRQLDVALTVS
jgi:hypothetical protein